MLSRELDDPAAIWVTEAWTDRDAHAASLDNPAAKDQIARAMPLIDGIAGRAEFAPIGGKGLTKGDCPLYRACRGDGTV